MWYLYFFCNIPKLEILCKQQTSEMQLNPLLAIAHKSARIGKISILKLEGIIKKILWASRLWVGRRKKPILGYVSKNYKKNNNSGTKGLSLSLLTALLSAVLRNF